eukprot:195281-Pleurochrysis_carterae.AAC.1
MRARWRARVWVRALRRPRHRSVWTQGHASAHAAPRVGSGARGASAQPAARANACNDGERPSVRAPPLARRELSVCHGALRRANPSAVAQARALSPLGAARRHTQPISPPPKERTRTRLARTALLVLMERRRCMLASPCFPRLSLSFCNFGPPACARACPLASAPHPPSTLFPAPTSRSVRQATDTCPPTPNALSRPHPLPFALGRRSAVSTSAPTRRSQRRSAQIRQTCT